MSVHDVARALPGIAALRDRCRALAAAEAVVSPDEDDRYYSFDEDWAPDSQLAEMRDGSGGEWSILFSPAGALIRGFDHESPMSPYVNDERLWPGLVDTVPADFAGCLTEPAFAHDGTLMATVVIWRRPGDDRWHTGDVEPDEDGADWLFQLLTADDPAEAYRDFAEDYYETDVDPATIQAIFRQPS